MSLSPSPSSPSQAPPPPPPPPTPPRPYQRIPSPKTCAWPITFTPSQLKKLKQGLTPQEMDDRWYVFSESTSEPGSGKEITVHFIRNYSGDEFFELVLEEVGDGGGKVKELRFESERLELDEKGAGDYCGGLCGGIWDGFWREGDNEE